jgi:hypothetical protein
MQDTFGGAARAPVKRDGRKNCEIVNTNTNDPDREHKQETTNAPPTLASAFAGPPYRGVTPNSLSTLSTKKITQLPHTITHPKLDNENVGDINAASIMMMLF